MSNLSNLVLAANPETPPETLKSLWFGYKEDLVVRAAIASNPNSPIEILVNASTQFPEFVANNPVLDFLLVENPMLFTKFTTDDLIALLQVDDFVTKYGVIILKLIFDSGYDIELNGSKTSLIKMFITKKTHLAQDRLRDAWHKYREISNYKPIVLHGMTFASCNMTCINLRGVSFASTYFNGVNFWDVEFEGSFNAVEFKNCSFSETKFSNITAQINLDFIACCFQQDTNFFSCDLKKTAYELCLFSETQWVECDLTMAELKSCQSNSHIAFIRSNVVGLKFIMQKLLNLAVREPFNFIINCDDDQFLVSEEIKIIRTDKTFETLIGSKNFIS